MNQKSHSRRRSRRRGRDGRARDRRQGTRRRRHHRHRGPEGGGRRRSTCCEACPIEGSDSRVVGLRRERRRLGADRELGRRRHHVRRAAQARHEPRRSAERQLQDHAVGDRADRQVLAEHDHRPGGEPARCDVPGGLPAQQVPARARHRHGRRARLGPHADLHRDGDRRVGREHPRVRARRPRRHDGAAAAILDDRRASRCPTTRG